MTYFNISVIARGLESSGYGMCREDAYECLIRYETVVPAMQDISTKTGGRKKGSYNTIATKWGSIPGGKDRFPIDPPEKCCVPGK